MSQTQFYGTGRRKTSTARVYLTELNRETADFTQYFAIEFGEENTYLESVSALSARLIGKLALVASFTVKNNSDVPGGAEDTDTYTALSLEYGF